ncbi:MAG: polysaccharide deacetylase family protein [Bacteroidales bacterium]
MDLRSVKIYSQGNVPRLRYIAGIILGDILGLPWEIVTDRRKLGKHPVINYSNETIPGAFKVSPFTLLFETGIRPQEILMGEWNRLPVFFQEPASDLPFDIFAASFYMVSRYEEYLEFQPDEHGRFRASSSLAFKCNFLTVPVVDLWAREFAKALLKRYPTLAFRRNEFGALLTIDTDQPFAYLGRNFLKSFGGMILDLTKGDGHAGDRYKVVNHEKKDPFEVYDYITGSIEKYKTEAIFFFPAGDHSRYDSNPSWKNEEYRSLINRISGKFRSGLHPSYRSHGRYNLLEHELQRLNNITGKEISSSRFHYIRLSFPSSYRDLLKAGIREDYSMGFPDEPGFRAGIARPYCFYDVTEDRQTDLKIVPFQVMDATLYQYKKLDPAASREVITGLIDKTRSAGGQFVSLWHNTSLLETPEWMGWRELFESTLQMQMS